MGSLKLECHPSLVDSKNYVQLFTCACSRVTLFVEFGLERTDLIQIGCGWIRDLNKNLSSQFHTISIPC